MSEEEKDEHGCIVGKETWDAEANKCVAIKAEDLSLAERIDRVIREAVDKKLDTKIAALDKALDEKITRILHEKEVQMEKALQRSLIGAGPDYIERSEIDTFVRKSLLEIQGEQKQSETMTKAKPTETVELPSIKSAKEIYDEVSRKAGRVI